MAVTNPADTQSVAAISIPALCQRSIRDYPCLPVLTAILSAVLPGVIAPDLLWIGAVLPVLLTAIAWYLLGRSAALYRVALPALAGLVSLFLNTNLRMTDSLSEVLHARVTAGIEAELEVCDPSIYNDGTPSAAYRQVQCRLTAVRFSPSDSWMTTDSLVIALFPPGTGNLTYGSRFLAIGSLNRPNPPSEPGSFDYGDYLKRQGVLFLFSIRQAENRGAAPSLYRKLLLCRDRLLRTLTAPLNRPEDRALAAGLLFGCRQGMSPESRQAFIRSGTIHLLTVSGLHIGMFAAALFLILLGVPFRVRMVAVPVLTLIYAAATGLRMPAARAVVMLFCWCLPQAFLLRGGGVNPVLLAASLLLLWNPFQLKDAGFQYSFLCVFFLIATASRTSECLRLTCEKLHWIPNRRISRTRRLLVRGLIGAGGAAAGCFTAWLCSLVLTVYYQGLTVPFAVPANLLVIPAAYIAYLIFAAALLPVLAVPQWGNWFGETLELPLSFIGNVCRSFAELADGRVPVPPLWTVFCALALLAVLFFVRNGKMRLAALAGFIGMLFFWGSDLFRERPAELLLLTGGRQRMPALVMSCPDSGFSMAANLADYRNAVTAANCLRQRGHGELTLLVSTGVSRDCTGGARYLFRQMKVRHYLAENPSRRTPTALQVRELAQERGAIPHFQPGKHLKWARGGQKLETFAENGEFSFDICENEHTLRITMISDPDGSTTVRVTGLRGQKPVELALPRDRIPGIRRMKLNW
ncbi:MAG: ComEC/Rec2 family competence protein [Lentisphaeria bacterium]|nr:ComEC/Rec2 family competence protein [Lentisphaeria bacterium]